MSVVLTPSQVREEALALADMRACNALAVDPQTGDEKARSLASQSLFGTTVLIAAPATVTRRYTECFVQRGYNAIEHVTEQ